MLRFRDLGVFVFEFGCSVLSFGCFVFEIWVLRFRDLGASCFGLRFRVLRFRNYRKYTVDGLISRAKGSYNLKFYRNDIIIRSFVQTC